MGKLYYNLGFLAANEVVEVSVRDLIAPFVGQTRSKTKAQLERALGKVLIIDNAFQLLKGHYEMEALQEMISFLQSEDHARKMIIILVGYAEEMKMLLHAFPALAGLFPHEVKFSGLKKKDCMKLLDHELEALNVSAPFMKDNACDDYQRLERLLHALAIGPMFANAKDIKFLAHEMKTRLFEDFIKHDKSKLAGSRSRSPPHMPDLSKAQATDCVTRLINQRICMKHLPLFVPQPEIEYSDHDSRFASAFAYAHMPMMEIRIEQAFAMPPQAAPQYDEADIFEDTLEVEQPSHFPLPVISTSIVLTSGLMAPSFSAVHAADALQYFKPPQEIGNMYRPIEEVDDESDDEHHDSGAAHLPATADVQSSTAHKQDLDTAAPIEVLGSASIAVTEATKISEYGDAHFQKASLKKTSEMDSEERRRYREMLRVQYPFQELVSVRTQQALRDLGYCPMGYAWKRDLGRHICSGGCHFGYDFDVRDHMYRNDM